MQGDRLILGITSHDYKSYEFDISLRKNIVESFMQVQYGDKSNWTIVNQDKRTWNFLHEIIPDENQSQIVLIIGEDEHQDMLTGKWHFAKDILDTYNIKVIPRTDGVSASKVRKFISENRFEEVKQLVNNTTYNVLKEANIVV
jgi:nicotinic acid mononucleotide adenylyltransferase